MTPKALTLAFRAIDGTTRCLFMPTRIERDLSYEEPQRERIKAGLRAVVNRIIVMGDEPSRGSAFPAYLALIRQPQQVPEHSRWMSYPLIWARPKPRDRAIRQHTTENYGVLLPPFAPVEECSLLPERSGVLPLTFLISPHLRRLYGDDLCEHLAWHVARRHFA